MFKIRRLKAALIKGPAAVDWSVEELIFILLTTFTHLTPVHSFYSSFVTPSDVDVFVLVVLV